MQTSFVIQLLVYLTLNVLQLLLLAPNLPLSVGYFDHFIEAAPDPTLYLLYVNISGLEPHLGGVRLLGRNHLLLSLQHLNLFVLSLIHELSALRLFLECVYFFVLFQVRFLHSQNLISFLLPELVVLVSLLLPLPLGTNLLNSNFLNVTFETPYLQILGIDLLLHGLLLLVLVFDVFQFSFQTLLFVLVLILNLPLLLLR